MRLAELHVCSCSLQVAKYVPVVLDRITFSLEVCMQVMHFLLVQLVVHVRLEGLLWVVAVHRSLVFVSMWIVKCAPV